MAGENKLSRFLDGTELLTYSYNKIKTSNVEQFIVVSSKENEPQASLLSHPYPNIVLQIEQDQGIGDSIALGVSHIKKNISSVIICLADMPLITNEHIKNKDLLYKINVSDFSVTTDLDTQDDWNVFSKSNYHKVYFDN